MGLAGYRRPIFLAGLVGVRAVPARQCRHPGRQRCGVAPAGGEPGADPRTRGAARLAAPPPPPRVPAAAAPPEPAGPDRRPAARRADRALVRRRADRDRTPDRRPPRVRRTAGAGPGAARAAVLRPA